MNSISVALLLYPGLGLALSELRRWRSQLCAAETQRHLSGCFLRFSSLDGTNVAPAALICFEVWGSWIRSQKCSILSEKSFRFSRKITKFPIFQATIFDDLFQSAQKSVIYHKNFKLPLTPTFFLFFWEIAIFQHTFSSKYDIHVVNVFSQTKSTTPLRPSATPTTASPKSEGCDPQLPGLTPLDFGPRAANYSTLPYAYSRIPTRTSIHVFNENERVILVSQQQSNFHLVEELVSLIEFIHVQRALDKFHHSSFYLSYELI